MEQRQDGRWRSRHSKHELRCCPTVERWKWTGKECDHGTEHVLRLPNHVRHSSRSSMSWNDRTRNQTNTFRRNTSSIRTFSGSTTVNTANDPRVISFEKPRAFHHSTRSDPLRSDSIRSGTTIARDSVRHNECLLRRRGNLAQGNFKTKLSAV